MNRVRLSGVWGLAAVLALGACGGGTAPRETIDIGGDMSSFPSFDIAVRDGAALAIAQAASIRGYPLRFVAYDDSREGGYSAERGADNVQEMVADPRMLGMVGPLRGPVVPAEMPIANKAMLAMVSPTVTEPCLTRPSSRCSLFHYDNPPQAALRLRPTGKNNYFHLAATDDLHGRAMAEFAYESLGLRKLAVVDDTYGFGAFASDHFVAAFIQAGGSVVARQTFDLRADTTPDFRSWLRRAKAAGAEGIYAGGLSVDPLAPRLQSEGIFDPSSPYLGVDGVPDLFNYGISDMTCPIRVAAVCVVSTVGDTMLSGHVYASRGIGAPYLNPRAAGTIAAFVKLHPEQDENNSETFAGYDSAAILIDAIGRAIDTNGGRLPSRRQVVEQLSKTANYAGLTGTYSFTAGGDPATSTLQIIQYQAGSWTPIKNIAVATQ